MTLEVFCLQSNYLSKLPEGIFKKSINLRVLDLAANNFETLHENLVKNNLKLRNINLSYNQLINIPSNIFDSIPFEWLFVNLLVNPCINLIFGFNFQSLEDFRTQADLNCKKTCLDFTAELKIASKEQTECEDEYEMVENENIVMRKKRKACLQMV